MADKKPPRWKTLSIAIALVAAMVLVDAASSVFPHNWPAELVCRLAALWLLWPVAAAITGGRRDR